MAVYLLVKADTAWNPGDLMCRDIGYIVEARTKSWLGGKAVPPKFCQICITDLDDIEAVLPYYAPWKKFIDWEFVGHNYTIDGHRLKVFMLPEVVSTTGSNSLTRDQVETFLNNWNATVFSIAANEVVFDITVFDAIKSEAFWNRDVSLLGWTENGYNSTEGIHIIEVNYSTYPVWTPDQVAKVITDRGGNITNSIEDKITFEISRSVVFDVFKTDVKSKIDGNLFAISKFTIPSQYVTAALNAGGTLNITTAQFQNYVHNRLDD